jgi:hypothetical protein
VMCVQRVVRPLVDGIRPIIVGGRADSRLSSTGTQKSLLRQIAAGI